MSEANLYIISAIVLAIMFAVAFFYKPRAKKQ